MIWVFAIHTQIWRGTKPPPFLRWFSQLLYFDKIRRFEAPQNEIDVQKIDIKGLWHCMTQIMWRSASWWDYALYGGYHKISPSPNPHLGASIFVDFMPKLKIIVSYSKCQSSEFFQHSWKSLSCLSIRAIFCQEGAVNNLPKKFSHVAQNFTKESKRYEGHTMQQLRPTCEVKIFLHMNVSYELIKYINSCLLTNC